MKNIVMKKNASRRWAFASAVMLLAGSPAFAQSTWTGLGSDSNWSTAGNWDVAPTFPATLTFAGTTQLAPYNDLTSGSFGVQVGTNSGTAMTFDAAAGEFTLGGNAITLAGHVGFSGDPATVVTQTISMPLWHNRTIGFNTPSNGVLSVNGGISALGSYGLWKDGEGLMILGKGTGNNFGSAMYIYKGILQFGENEVISGIPGFGVAASSVSPTVVDLAGTTQIIPTALTLGNQGPATNGLENQAIDSVGGGLLRLTGGFATVFAGGSGFSNGLATISCDVEISSNFSWYLQHNPDNEVDLLISGGITNTGTFCLFYGQRGEIDPAVVEITSTNNHTPTIGVRHSVTLRLGANNTLPPAAQLQLAGQTGGKPTIDLRGTTNTCGGVVLGAGGTSVAGTQPSVIDSVGGGVLKLGGAVNYNIGSAGTQNGTATISATLDLDGANRGFNIGNSANAPVDLLVTGTIINSGGAPAGINKNSPGTMVLASANSYDGNTTINDGTLQLDVASLNPAAAVNINNVGINNVLLTLNFAGTNIVSAFNTNGVPLADGVYNAANMPGVISGSGSLQVGAAVTPPTPAFLTNSVSGSTLTFTWPSGQSWRLVGQTNSTGLNPDPNAWFTVPGGIDGSNSIAIDPANPTVFYRLVWP